MTTPRLDISQVYPAGKKALLDFDAALADPGADTTLTHLIRIRASQVNGCALCLDMHTQEARQAGESEQRIYLLDAWRETELFTEPERAVLALTEAVTRIGDGHVPDEVFQQAAKHFDEETVARLVMAMISINAWNRLGIVQRPPVGK
jgi:AhpD family alkylhydroperoxidase